MDHSLRPYLGMGQTIRERTEQRELELLSPLAAHAGKCGQREVAEPNDPIRTCFQRDRDRILHCKSFRRLKHKTQVFIDPSGDHYRTRLTHSLEVAQIARTIGRALRLNEDLIEAIALGHDVGHTPFGHAGEHALNEAIETYRQANPDAEGPYGFRHYEQSLRVVDVLEGLNLTEETRLGIGGHSKGRKDLTAFDGEPSSTLEAAVVRISDRVAYLNHDLDDALRSGILKDVPSEFRQLGDSHGQRIGAMVGDVIERSLEQPAIRLSNSMLDLMNAMKELLFEEVYTKYPSLYPDTLKAQNLVIDLFNYFVKPGNLPSGYSGLQGAVDYVAGMTDRFAMDTFADLWLPRGFRSPR